MNSFASVAAELEQMACAQVQGHPVQALTLTRLTVMFGVHPRTFERWYRYGFPAALPHKPGMQRYWHPASVLAWVRAREVIARTTCNIAAVYSLTHRSSRIWRRLVKTGEAPAPVSRELGSGQDLWLIQDIKDWLDRTSGGFIPPPRSAPPSLSGGRRGPKRVCDARNARHSPPERS